MKENKDEPRRVATCFEGTPCAEMMEKIMGEEGIGSLCEEMMRVLTQQEPAPKRDGSGKTPCRPRQGQKANKRGERK